MKAKAEVKTIQDLRTETEWEIAEACAAIGAVRASGVSGLNKRFALRAMHEYIRARAEKLSHE